MVGALFYAKYSIDKNQAQLVFNFLDFDGNQSLSNNTLYQALKSTGSLITSEECRLIFQRADTSENGYLTFHDFFNIMIGKNSINKTF